MCAVAIPFASLLMSLFTAKLQFTASPKGLQTLAILAIIGNLALCLLFVWFIVIGYRARAAEWMLWGMRHHVTSFFLQRQGLKQFIRSAIPSQLGLRHSSGELMLLSGVTLPSGSMHRSSMLCSKRCCHLEWQEHQTYPEKLVSLIH